MNITKKEALSSLNKLISIEVVEVVGQSSAIKYTLKSSENTKKKRIIDLLERQIDTIRKTQ